MVIIQLAHIFLFSLYTWKKNFVIHFKLSNIVLLQTCGPSLRRWADTFINAK